MMQPGAPGGTETPSQPFHLQDVHVWMRHGEGEHQVLLAEAELLEDNDPRLVEIERQLFVTRDLDWNLTERGILQATFAGIWMARHLLTPGPYGLIVPNGEFDGGYTSPTNRCEQSTAISLLAATAELGRSAIRLDQDGHPFMPIDTRLREINLGDLIMLTRRAYRQLHPDNAARRKIDPLFTAPPGGTSIVDHMDLVIRSLLTSLGRDVRSFHTTLGRDAERGSKSALMSTSGRTIRAAGLTIRRNHPKQFDQIERDEEIINSTLFITRRTPNASGFNQFAVVYPWIELKDGSIALNDQPPNFIKYRAPRSRAYADMLSGLSPEQVARFLALRRPAD